MRKRILFLLAILVVLVGGVFYQLKATPTLPLNQTIDRSGVWQQAATERTFFTWGGTLYYVYTDRDLSGSTKQMKIVRESDQAVISTFGSGYGCQDAIVDSGTLYVFATNCFMDYSHQQNSIVKFTTTNLTSWSGPTTIYTMESTGQTYNVGVGSDGAGNFLITYDVHNAYWYADYFLTRFLTSTNLSSFTDVGASNAHNLGGYMEDSGVLGYQLAGARTNGTTQFYVNYATAGGTAGWARSAPFTWDTGDFWSGMMTYFIG